LHSKAVRDRFRAIECLEQRIANRTAVFTPLTSTAGKFDTLKASVAIRTGDIGLFHEFIMLEGTRLANPLAGVTWASHRRRSLRRMTDEARAQIAGWIALFALMLLGAYIMVNG
jgi:hypothetical protein